MTSLPQAMVPVCSSCFFRPTYGGYRSEQAPVQKPPPLTAQQRAELGLSGVVALVCLIGYLVLAISDQE